MPTRAPQGRLVVHGGYSGSNRLRRCKRRAPHAQGLCSYFNDMFVLHPERLEWQRVWCSGPAPPPLYAHTLNCVAGKIVVCCGGTGRNYSNRSVPCGRLRAGRA